MQFASLASAWFALALPAIVIMYLFKRKYIDTEISSHLLWNRVLKDIEANRPWQKLRNNLLMLIQLLVAALLVLALMQPFIWSKSTQSAHILIVLDRSASMETLVAGSEETPQTRLEIAKQKVLETIENKNVNQPITLLTMGEQAEMLLSKVTDKQMIAQAISDIQVHYGRTAYQETMSLASALTRQEPNAEIRIYTDGQWTESIQGISYNVPVQVEKIADGEVENVNVIQFGVKKDLAKPDAVIATATLKNWGTQTQTVELSLYRESELHIVQQEELQAGEQKTLFFNELPVAHYYQLTVEAEDLFKIDNRSYALLANDQVKRALLLSPGNLFLEKALQLSGVSIMKTQPNEHGILVIPESDFDLIVIDTIDANMLASAQWRELLTEKPVWYIAYDLNPSVRVEPSSSFTMKEHPITEYIQFEDTHIAVAKQYEALPWGEAVISAQHVPLVYADVVQGQRRVLFTFDLHHSDLPLRSEFPVLVGNTVDWLVSGQIDSLGHAMANEQLEISLSPKTERAEWINITHSGTPFSADTIDGHVSHIQTVPPVPGLYQFIEQDQSGNPIQTRYLNVMIDARESNLAFQPDLVFPLESQSGQDQGVGMQEDQADHGFLPYSLLPWLIMLIIIFIFVEWGVYQRGTSL